MKKKILIIFVSIFFSAILWVSISLSNNYLTTVEVNLKIINFPEGYTTGSPLPEKISIKLRGRGWKLTAARMSSDTEYLISADNDSGWVKINTNSFLVENAWLSSDIEVMDIYPDTISFFVEKIITRKLKIIPNVSLSFKQGFGLATPVSLQPESTLVEGPASVLRRNIFIQTENMIYSKLDSKSEKEITLLSRQGMKYQNEKVKIVFDVQRIVEKNFDNVLINILDVPKDRSVTLLPNSISVGIRGGIDYLGKINADQFYLFINYRDIIIDTLGSVKPKYELPENVSLMYLKPENVRYIIKKY